MKIVNSTDYRTADLKKLFLAACREVRTGSRIRKRLQVVVVKHNRLKSKANYWGSWAKIVIHDWMLKEPQYLSRIIAWVACHEFLHSKGIHHRRMGARYAFFYRGWDYKNEKMAWADNYPLRLKETKPKEKPDLQMRRYEKTLGKVKEYTQKVKRYQNLLKKYQASQRRYEKVLMAAAKLPKR